jgi:formate hydrogenlyase subunit 3/multisubunit Na+/H+ antiporter MnhD subunit
MNDTAVKAFVALIPACALFTGAMIIFVRRRSISSFLQLVGAAGLVAVILTHVFEGLRVFPRMGWGSHYSVGHYLDLLSAILAVTLFSLGYLIHAVNARERDRQLHQRQPADRETW